MGSRQVRVSAVLILLVFRPNVCVLAQVTAKPGGGASSSRQAHPSAKAPKQGATAEGPDLGSVRDREYHNASFGIWYKLGFGWVQRTDSMRDAPPAPTKSYVLLAAFERPPEAAGDSVNSAVIITAESLSEYPGLEQAVDYFDVLDELTSSKGFKVLNPPYEFPVGTKKLARGDYSKKIGGDLTMYQGSLVMLEKGYVIAFTFIAGSEEELESLVMDLKLGTSAKRPEPATPK
jgi:hypothetical protein